MKDNKTIYNKELTECPLCKSGLLNNKFNISRFNPPFKIDECTECGFIFMNPQYNSKYISEMYCENYYTGKAEYSYYDERDAEKYSKYVWKNRLKKIRQYSKDGNFLDIGCAFGGFLKTASEFFVPYGIEFSEYSAKQARMVFGKNIHAGTIGNHPFNADFFSVITMIELIEHLSDPVSAVKECYKLLRKNGLLLIQTANMDGMQARILKDMYGYFLPGHLSYFTKRNLTKLLRQAGFEKIKVFYPVEFGLMPKLLKSRYNFCSVLDYYKWIRISYYHFISKIRFGNFAATSSMVVYAFK
jgi:2-polyprenyl-3-methyl-5-hydroxy-6-metoxy-1,4-benzoquinol methylase